jgi:ubiquinone/menaquinone biosynthesis C-methylase UbiE
MPDVAFRLMSIVMAVKDFVYPTIDRRIVAFGIRENMTIVDYGCGPRRYTTRFSSLVGANGQVYAVDVQRLAIEMLKRKMDEQDLRNIVPILAQGYKTGIPDHVADIVCAIDIFFGVREPSTFLREIHRITKPEGILIIDDGHQSRQETLLKIKASGYWRVAEETHDHLKCLAINQNNV